MAEYDFNSYYALVWNTSLNDEVYIEGRIIGKDTELPKDPRMLYGANVNDVFKVRNVEFKTEVTYDPLTTKQSVKYIPIVEEYNIKRDVRVIVWEGSDVLELPYGSYRIMTPQSFNIFVESFSRNGGIDWKGLSKESPVDRVYLKACSDPENKMSANILDMLMTARSPGIQ